MSKVKTFVLSKHTLVFAPLIDWWLKTSITFWITAKIPFQLCLSAAQGQDSRIRAGTSAGLQRGFLRTAWYAVGTKRNTLHLVQRVPPVHGLSDTVIPQEDPWLFYSHKDSPSLTGEQTDCVRSTRAAPEPTQRPARNLFISGAVGSSITALSHRR